MQAEKQILRLATTTTMPDSGLLSTILPIFESESGVKVEVQAVGSGKALALGRTGQIDVVLVHARREEDEFVNKGHGVNRRNVMYNSFVLLGPPEDPLQIHQEKEIVSALIKIAKQSVKFVSRYDRSGTHLREMQLWALAGLKPGGHWYIKANAGMLETLNLASDEVAYVLTDYGTFLFNEKALDLIVVLEGDTRLFNPYGVIAVNPERHPEVHYEASMQFIEFLTSLRGQELIAGHGALRFSRPLFKPTPFPLVGDRW